MILNNQLLQKNLKYQIKVQSGRNTSWEHSRRSKTIDRNFTENNIVQHHGVSRRNSKIYKSSATLNQISNNDQSTVTLLDKKKNYDTQYTLIPKEQLFRKTRNGKGRTIADAKRQNYGFQPMSYLMYKSKQNQKFNYRKNSLSDNKNNLNSKSVNLLSKTNTI